MMAFERRSSAGWAVHPGEILNHEFLKPMNISGYRLSKAINVNAQRVNDILLKKTGISADMAIRLARFFGTSAEFWMNLQAAYELVTAKKILGSKIGKIKTMTGAA
jgi:addiction module HigA family antidote